ncbi:hydrogenase maturation protease [Streptomyces sp. NPDC087228]|uniref:hydrogenase maturation protease n=1 Tax=Streptomyces sp. NPDC087228 TaxID=3365772 RepID=UPI00380DDB3B
MKIGLIELSAHSEVLDSLIRQAVDVGASPTVYTNSFCAESSEAAESAEVEWKVCLRNLPYAEFLEKYTSSIASQDHLFIITPVDSLCGQWLCPSPRTDPARTRCNWRACPAGKGKRVNLTTRIAVIGVGNEFRHDDGVGWTVVAQLAERAEERPLPSGTALLVCDGDPARLIALWEDADLAILVDAAHAHPRQPGRLHRLELDGVQLSQTSSATSSHGLGLGDAVELARELDRLPRQMVVYAVEGADSSLGTGLSAPVAAIVEPLAERIAEEIALHVGSAGSR